MKALLVGYGSMGREVERVLSERGHGVAARVDPVDPGAEHTSLEGARSVSADVVIEFSVPGAVLPNVRRYAELGLSAVVGTTGWQAHVGDVRQIVESSGIGLLYGSNFSIGAHLFFGIVDEATRRIDSMEQYDISILEIHHKRKKDSPSGTALTVAKTVLGASTRKKKVVTDKLDRAIEPEELHVASVRGGAFPGTHTVLFDSLADTIEITHTARSRGGFALGAVMAAEWIRGKKGLYEVSEFVRALSGRK
jgi:4-hydroxy-tetrahydrodipicolinate reductase